MTNPVLVLIKNSVGHLWLRRGVSEKVVTKSICSVEVHVHEETCTYLPS